MNTNNYDKAMQESCTTDCIHYRQGTCPYRYNMKLECTRFRMYYGYQPEEPGLHTAAEGNDRKAVRKGNRYDCTDNDLISGEISYTITSKTPIIISDGKKKNECFVKNPYGQYDRENGTVPA